MSDTPAENTALDVDRLVTQVLESDEALRREADDAQLGQAELVGLLTQRLAEPDALGRLEIRTRLDTAQRELDAAEARFGGRRDRPPWLGRARLVWAVLVGLTIVGIAVFDYLLNVTLGGTVIFAWVGLMAGVWLLRRWGDQRYDTYVKALREDLTDRQATFASLQEEFETDIVESWVKPAIRGEVNKRAGSKLRTHMDPVEYQGLAGDDPRHTIGTAARDRLEQFLLHKSYGSIGLSGPRGAGKTSLIRASCPDGDVSSDKLFGVIVTAPIEFEAREFVLHLFGRLCSAVLGRDGVERVRRPRSPVDRDLRTPQALLVVAALALLAAAAIVLVSEELVREEIAWAAVIGAAGVLTLAAVGWAEFVRRRYRVRSEPTPSAFSDDLRQHAASRLRDIWFQQSFTSGWSGAVKLPVGVEGGVEGTHELSRLQMSLPDVVAEIEYLVDRIVAEDRSVRIGIDELDKLADTDRARQFLNEMKVLFGVRECFWLVSISEDAMSSFERRGLPVRDEFDSSFTNVIRVSPQTADGTIELLRRRLVGVPQPIMLLCHCLAGGLPRDLLRVAWDVVTHAKEHGTSHLKDISAALVREHVLAKVDATLVATHRLEPAPPVHGLQAWLMAVRQQGTDPESLLKVCHEAPLRLESVLRTGKGADEALELVSYCLFAATCQEFFRRQPIDELDQGTWQDFKADADRLATAQQAFAVHPQAAWIATSAVRVGLRLEEVSYPEPPPAAPPPVPSPAPV
jgi:hypothetical protein